MLFLLDSANLLNPHVSVDCVVFGFDNEKLKVLLIQQKLPQSTTSRFALPGDLIRNDEGLESAASRVLRDISGLEGVFLRQFKAFGHPQRVSRAEDSEFLNNYRKKPQARVITIAFFALVKMENFTPTGSGFAERAFWQDLQNCPPLAFDHSLILDEALKKLQHDFARNHTGFELLPNKFTLGQIQKLYEAILARPLDKRNFRKKILNEGLVKATTEKQKGVLHKPALLYTVNKP